VNDRQYLESGSLSKTGGPGRDRQAGQSLVEMALVMPILLLMLLGVLEVGWALRGYLVLANANREATRFAARGRYLDFNQTTPETIGYSLVVSHTYDSLAAQLPVDLSPTSGNGGIIISHYVMDTGQPCINMSSCICSEDPAQFDDDNAGNIADYDDEWHGPGPAWDDTDYWRYNSRPDELQSRLDDAALLNQLKDENNVFNCQLYKKDDQAPWSVNSVVAVELFYDQPQLLGIFDTQSVLGRAIIPNPIPFYTHTVMRITADARSGGRTPDGLGCQLWPIALKADTLSGVNQSDVINIWNGGGTGNFGWLRWPSATSAGNVDYLIQEIYNPNLSATDFEDACEAGDTLLNAGDCVWANTGVSNSSDLQDALEWLKTKSPAEIRIPVWDTSYGTGSNLRYHIVGFAVVRVIDYSLPSNNQQNISAEFVGWDNDSCPGNSH
jgi:hypothetical protein